MVGIEEVDSSSTARGLALEEWTRALAVLRGSHKVSLGRVARKSSPTHPAASSSPRTTSPRSTATSIVSLIPFSLSKDAHRTVCGTDPGRPNGKQNQVLWLSSRTLRCCERPFASRVVSNSLAAVSRSLNRSGRSEVGVSLVEARGGKASGAYGLERLRAVADAVGQLSPLLP